MKSVVRISWTKEFDNAYAWNEACAWAVERFGLPGDKFTTEVNVNYMEFHFDCHKDALMMALRYNAKILNENCDHI